MSNLPPMLSSLAERITAKFEFLSDYGYKLKGISYGNPDGVNEKGVFRPYVKLFYSNEKNRNLVLRFYDKGIASCRIENIDGHGFDLDHYLVYKKENPVGTQFFQEKQGVDLPQYFMMKIEKYLTTDLLDVLRGEKWIDVPFDWQGQK